MPHRLPGRRLRSALLGLGLLAVAAILVVPWLSPRLAGYAASERARGDAARALIRVASHTDPLVPGPHDRRSTAEDVAVYRKTLLALIQSRVVAEEALRQPQIARLDLVRREDEPSAWLADHVRAEFVDGSELLAVSWDGRTSSDHVALVNAVVNAFMARLVEEELSYLHHRLETLRGLRSNYWEEFQSKSESLRKLKALAGREADRFTGEEVALRALEDNLRRVETAVFMLEINLKSPPRVTLIQQPKFSDTAAPRTAPAAR